MPMTEDKPFVIPKPMVWEAWRRVRANKGAPGVDGQAIEQFEADLAGNLYKIWNRMSSGSYLPPPVRAVAIPKPHGGGVRMLGVPTVSDRVAQTVVAMHLEERADHRFYPDSYGYRPGKSAHQALAACRQRCWKDDWVIDLDVQKFFDEVPWDLVVRAVKAVTDARWALLYVERWLAAPLEHPGGALEQRSKGTPQGSAVSPTLANLFMHYAFDSWMVRNLPGCPFEALRRRRRRASHEPAAGRACACRDRRADAGGRLAAAPGQDADRPLQGRSAPGRARAHRVYLPRLRLPGTGGTHQRRPVLHRLSARDQPRGAEGQRRPAPRDAVPPAHRPDARRPGAMAEPHPRRVDQLLRPVLPVGDLCPPAAPQRLPAALGRAEIQTAANREALQEVAGRAVRTTTRPVHPLARGPHVLGPIRRAR